MEKIVGPDLTRRDESSSFLCLAVISLTFSLANVPFEIQRLSAAVQKYYKSHSAALERARAAIGNYCAPPPIDLQTNPSLMKVLTAIFTEVVEEIAPDFKFPSSILKKCDSPKHGDYQCSVTMPAFASLKKSGNMPEGVSGPAQLAQVIIDKVGKGHGVIESMRIQGPGFIMCKVSPTYLQGHIKTMMSNKSLSKPIYDGAQQTCLVDFSSPNIASKFQMLYEQKFKECILRAKKFTMNIH
jgi:hypothetical protein